MYKTRLSTSPLGSTGMEISRVGFGAWAIGGGGWEFGWGPQQDEDSIEAIHRALHLGVNWIDTAAAYGFGRSERVVGQALQGVTDRPYVFTKASLLDDGTGQVRHSLKRDSILRETEASLRRLGVDAIDLYQIHWPIPAEDIEEGWSALAELKECGLVRHIGVSNFDVAQLRRISSIAPVETLQPPYSLVDRAAEEEILPFAARSGIGVIVYSPMGSGLLTGAMTRERRLAQPGPALHRAATVPASRAGQPAAAGGRPARGGARRGGGGLDAAPPRRGRGDRRVPAAQPGRPDHGRGRPRIDRQRPGRYRSSQVVRRTTMTTVGFVGLGAMGSRVAGRLLDGNQVYGTNRTADKASGLIEQGMTWYGTPREVAGKAEVIFSMVTDDAALRAITEGPDGILAGLTSGQVYVDMSTVSPDLSREIARRVRGLRASMLDAPVSGSVAAAESGTLTIMVGGPEQAYRTAEPLLRQAGRTVSHVGGNGQALLLKLAINISLAAQMLAFSEGVLLAERGGIDPALAAAVMTESPVGSPMLKARAPLMLDLPAQAWFDVRLMHKDIRLAQQAAYALGVPAPSANVAGDLLAQAEELGYGRRDIAALFQVLGRLAA
jgi:3-hydroxyisobutyrate dehydrogenase-like beta-hydroxyacid dehydrogenase/aryl-alcohol dehydrogenase-like predicted oxidoreductase